jgi:hypothetical protein
MLNVLRNIFEINIDISSFLDVLIFKKFKKSWLNFNIKNVHVSFEDTFNSNHVNLSQYFPRKYLLNIIIIW